MGNTKLYGIDGHVTETIDAAWLRDAFHAEYAAVTVDPAGYLGPRLPESVTADKPWILAVAFSHSMAANQGVAAFAKICVNGCVSLLDYDYPEMYCWMIKDRAIVGRYIGDLRKVPHGPLSLC
jgi:hypothetical protein